MVASAVFGGGQLGQILVGTGSSVANYITSVSGTTVNFSQALTTQAAGTYTCFTPYVNRSSHNQQLVITGSAVTPTYYLIIGTTMITLPTNNQVIVIPPGGMFLASWVSGTPNFQITLMN